jgi:hypothetical protein
VKRKQEFDKVLFREEKKLGQLKSLCKINRRLEVILNKD